jgi:hypothetical protein
VLWWCWKILIHGLTAENLILLTWRRIIDSFEFSLSERWSSSAVTRIVS